MHKMYQTLKWLRYSSSSDWSEELLKICSIAPGNSGDNKCKKQFSLSLAET